MRAENIFYSCSSVEKRKHIVGTTFIDALRYQLDCQDESRSIERVARGLNFEFGNKISSLDPHCTASE